MANNKKLSPSTRVKVTNNYNSSISFWADGKKFLFLRPNSFLNIEFRYIQELYSNCPAMIEKGYIIFEKEVYEELEVSEEMRKKILNIEEVEKLLNESAEKIEEILEDTTEVVKENLALKAKEKGIDSKKKEKVIKEKTGFNIISEDE